MTRARVPAEHSAAGAPNRSPLPSTGSRSASAELASLSRSAAAPKSLARLPLRRPLGKAAAALLQRNVGFEFEVFDRLGWRVTGHDGKPVTKGVPVIVRPGFQLQAEYSGESGSTLEFVTDPPGVENEAGFNKMIGEMVKLAGELDPLAGKKAKEVEATRFKGGIAGLRIKPGDQPISAGMQITAGVPLASVPALYKNLGALTGSKDFDTAIARGAETAGKLGKAMFSAASDDLKGFVTLIHQYLIETKDAGQARNAPFPKGAVSVMARTDFHKMFEMLPEGDAIAQDLKLWVDTLMEVAKLDEDDPVLPHVYDDPYNTDPAMRIKTSHKEWLQDMPVRDRLSNQGRRAGDVVRYEEKSRVTTDSKGVEMEDRPAEYKTVRNDHDLAAEKVAEQISNLYEGLGSQKSKTDTVQYAPGPGAGNGAAPQQASAAIVEIRRSGLSAGGAANWAVTGGRVFKAVDSALKQPQGAQGPTRAYTNVPDARQKKLHADSVAFRKAVNKANERAQQLAASGKKKKSKGKSRRKASELVDLP